MADLLIGLALIAAGVCVVVLVSDGIGWIAGRFGIVAAFASISAVVAGIAAALAVFG